MLLVLFLPVGYAILMRSNKPETAVNVCHCPSDMAVRVSDRELVLECITCFYCLKGVIFVVDFVKCVPNSIKNQDDHPYGSWPPR